MKKKPLALLLTIPFVIALLTFASIQILDNQVAVDILGIEWDYKENEGFQIDETHGYPLKAKAIVDPSLILANGNNLVWKTKKINQNDEDFAKIEEDENGNFSLLALKEGEVEVICSNQRGSVSKFFNAIIYKDGAMVINPVRKGSGANIDSTKYYGAKDLTYTELKKDAYQKVDATFKVETTAYSDTGESHQNVLVDSSDNLSYDNLNGTVTIRAPQKDSFLKLQDPVSHFFATYSFDVLDAVNVYSYDDLLMATNFSTNGENVVLGTNLESLKNTYKTNDKGEAINELKSENTSLFGHYDFTKKTYSFEKELYTFETTYDSKFIDDFNKATKGNYSKTLKAGISLKKDLYGNGFSINMDALCFPHNGSIDTTTGKLKPDAEKDYFHGPLPFVGVGDISKIPLVVALGQDNAGIYVEKDGVTINDVKLSNVDESDNLYQYTYTGSVLDVESKNVTISNSILSDGKVCLRAYDADNLLLENSILKKAGEFLLLAGSNKKGNYDTSRRVKETMGGNAIDKSFNEFFDDVGESNVGTANERLNAFINATVSGTLKEYDYAKDLDIIQKYLDNGDAFLDENGAVSSYAASMTIKDTLFGRSGVFGIASESMFNGPLLYGGIPSSITSLLAMLDSPTPNKVGGTSAPIHITLEGDCRFYDWKELDSIDVSSLIEENISTILKQLNMGDKSVTIDDIFPMKNALRKVMNQQGLIYKLSDKDYINTAIAYYGGGLNVSKVSGYSDSAYNTYSEPLEVSLVDEIINSGQSGMRAMLVDCVVVTIGSHPFHFITNGKAEATKPILLDEVPKIDDLKAHVSINKGE